MVLVLHHKLLCKPVTSINRVYVSIQTVGEGEAVSVVCLVHRKCRDEDTCTIIVQWILIRFVSSRILCNVYDVGNVRSLHLVCGYIVPLLYS